MARDRRCGSMATGALLAMALTAVILADAGAAPVAQPQSYEDCARRVDVDAALALRQAEAWSSKGGGDAATRCRARALLRLARPAEAAPLYEQLAFGALRLPERADFFALAAAAWRLADRPEDGLRTIDAALAIYPEAPALWVDRAEALVALGRDAEAIEALSRALDLDATDLDARLLRANAYRRTENLAAAAVDVERVLAVNPANGEALFERGALRRMRGDTAAARADWLMAIATAPDSPAAAAAREALARLEGENPR